MTDKRKFHEKGNGEIKITLRDRWDDLSRTGERYVELKLGKAEVCCVKETADGFIQVMDCEDGNNVYSDIGGADWSLRKLTPEEEQEVMEFVKEQFEAEATLDHRYFTR